MLSFINKKEEIVQFEFENQIHLGIVHRFLGETFEVLPVALYSEANLRELQSSLNIFGYELVLNILINKGSHTFINKYLQELIYIS